jgi:hypothetical protein
MSAGKIFLWEVAGGAEDHEDRRFGLESAGVQAGRQDTAHSSTAAFFSTLPGYQWNHCSRPVEQVMDGSRLKRRRFPRNLPCRDKAIFIPHP